MVLADSQQSSQTFSTRTHFDIHVKSVHIPDDLKIGL